MSKKPIYELVSGEKELVDEIIANELTEEDRVLIKRRETERLNKEDNGKFFMIVARIKTRLKNKDINRIPTRAITRRTIYEMVEEEKEKKTNNTFEQNYKELLSIIINDPIVIKEIDIMDIAITCVRYGIGKSKEPRDVDTISKFFSIPKEEVEDISTNTLRKLHSSLVSKINGSEDDIKKLIKQNEDNN